MKGVRKEANFLFDKKLPLRGHLNWRVHTNDLKESSPLRVFILARLKPKDRPGSLLPANSNFRHRNASLILCRGLGRLPMLHQASVLNFKGAIQMFLGLRPKNKEEGILLVWIAFLSNNKGKIDE